MSLTGSRIRTKVWLKQLCSSPQGGWWFSFKWIYLRKLINAVINSKRKFRTLFQIHTEKNWLELSKNIHDNGMVRYFFFFSQGKVNLPQLSINDTAVALSREGTHRSTTQCSENMEGTATIGRRISQKHSKEDAADDSKNSSASLSPYDVPGTVLSVSTPLILFLGWATWGPKGLKHFLKGTVVSGGARIWSHMCGPVPVL